MAATALARNKAAALKGGGAKLIGAQMERNVTTGALQILAAGTDCIGMAAGTWHQFGSLESIDIPRDANGHYKLTPTLVEWDIARRNLLSAIAPYNANASASKKDALSLEDGEVIESTDTTGEDTTLPYWLLIYRGAPLADGTETAFFCVAQAERAGGAGASKDGAHNKLKISFNTIDAEGFEAEKPTTGDDSTTWLTSITAPTLEDNAAHGIWVEATA